MMTPAMQSRIKPLEGSRLGIGTNLSHHSSVQILGSSRLPAMPQTLMQLPDRIPEPGELQGAEITGACRKRVLPPDPVAQAASWV